MASVMLTTTDNPFNPFTQFDEWKNYDESNGYNSCGLVDRIAKTSDELSELDQQLAIERAIDEIVSLNAIGLYEKVVDV